MIYFIKSPEGPIKIGTTIQLAVRLKQLTKEYGEGLELLAITDGSYDMETELHRRFAHLRFANEWFDPADELLGFIVSEGKQWSPDLDSSSSRNTSSVKIDAEVVAEAKMVAASMDMTLAEYLSDLLRPIVRKDLDQEHSRRSKLGRNRKDE